MLQEGDVSRPLLAPDAGSSCSVSIGSSTNTSRPASRLIGKEDYSADYPFYTLTEVKLRPWCLRPVCGKRLLNWHLILLICILIVLLSALPLLYFVIVPRLVERAITGAPPLNIRTVDIQRIHLNETISIDFAGLLQVQIPTESEFLANRYNFSLVLYEKEEASVRQKPRASHFEGGISALFSHHEQYLAAVEKNRKRIQLNMGFLDLGDLTATPGEPLAFLFPSTFHGPDFEHVQKIVELVSDFLQRIYGLRDAKTALVDTSVYDYTIALEGYSTLKMLGLPFYNIHFLHEIPINYDFKDYIKRMDVQLDKCLVLHANPDGSDWDCLHLMHVGSDVETELLFLSESIAEGLDNLQIQLSISLLNPTAFGMHLGTLNCTLDHLPHNDPLSAQAFGDAYFEQFDLPYTNFSATERVQLSVVAKPRNPFAAIDLFLRWKRGEDLHFSLKGDKMKLGGYRTGDLQSELMNVEMSRIHWFESLLTNLDVRLKMTAPHL